MQSTSPLLSMQDTALSPHNQPSEASLADLLTIAPPKDI